MFSLHNDDSLDISNCLLYDLHNLITIFKACFQIKPVQWASIESGMQAAEVQGNGVFVYNS